MFLRFQRSIACAVFSRLSVGICIDTELSLIHIYSFDLMTLLRFAGTYSPNRTFVRRVRSGERRIILELEKLAAPQSAITSIPTFTRCV